MDTNTDNLLKDGQILVEKTKNLLKNAERYYIEKELQDAYDELHQVLTLFTPILQDIKAKDETMAQMKESLAKVIEETTLLRSKLPGMKSNVTSKENQDYDVLKQENETLENKIVEVEEQMNEVTAGLKDIQSQKASLAKDKEELEALETQIEQKRSELRSLWDSSAKLEKELADFKSGATEDLYRTNIDKVKYWNETLRSHFKEVKGLMKDFHLQNDAFDELLMQETLSPDLPNATHENTEAKLPDETNLSKGTNPQRYRYGFF